MCLCVSRVELTLGEIACLKKCNPLRSHQAHSILQVEVTFSIKTQAYCRVLDDS